jgi:hypothetical protein
VHSDEIDIIRKTKHQLSSALVTFDIMACASRVSDVAQFIMIQVSCIRVIELCCISKACSSRLAIRSSIFESLRFGGAGPSDLLLPCSYEPWSCLCRVFQARLLAIKYAKRIASSMGRIPRILDLAKLPVWNSSSDRCVVLLM